MTKALHTSIVRIKTTDNVIVGAGFLVTKRHILTCAHVINATLEKSAKDRPLELVHLDFPFIAPQQTMTARVVFWEPKQLDNTGDIAGLEINGTLPDGVSPTFLYSEQNTWGHPFRAFGFPANHDDGVWVSGVLRDKKTNGLVQIEDVKAPGYSIQPGFSGAPVWDDDLQAVVGMIVTSERRAEVKAAFMIPTTNFVKSWSLLGEQHTVQRLNSVQVPTVEAPLLIGVLVDVSGSVVKALRKNASVTRSDLSEAFDLLVRKIIEACQSSDSNKVLPKIALFVYGFGFGRWRKGVGEFLQRVGLIAPSEQIAQVSSEVVRDLFTEVNRKYGYPITPNAAILQKFGERYKEGLKDQLVDTELGPSVLYDGLSHVYLRLRQEMETLYYPHPLLIVISDGQVEGSSHEDVTEICQQIAKLGVNLAFCYIGMQDVTSPKTFYSQPSPEWPKESRFLFELSSPLAEEIALLQGLADEAKIRGWHVPEHARLFVQVNQSEDLAEFVEMLLSKLHG